MKCFPETKLQLKSGWSLCSPATSPRSHTVSPNFILKWYHIFKQASGDPTILLPPVRVTQGCRALPTMASSGWERWWELGEASLLWEPPLELPGQSGAWGSEGCLPLASRCCRAAAETELDLQSSMEMHPIPQIQSWKRLETQHIKLPDQEPHSFHLGYLFCVVTTTVVFADVNACELLSFFQENGSRTAISNSSPLITFTSRYHPIRKLEKQSKRSSLQRPGFLEKTKWNLVLVIIKTSRVNTIFLCTYKKSDRANSHLQSAIILFPEKKEIF